MGQRPRNTHLLSMMDTPEMQGLASYLTGGRMRRDGAGHGNPVVEDDDPDNPPGEEDDEDDEEEEDEDEKPKSKKSSKSKKKDDDDDEDEDDKPRYSTAEYEKVRNRMRAADKRATELQAELDKAKADSSTLDETTKKELSELKPKLERLTADNAGLRLQIAFLTTRIRGVEWEDPEAALKLVDLSDVDVDENGNVDKRDLARALKDLAKRKSYLVKKSKPTADDDEEDEDEPPSRRASGTPMNKRRGAGKDGASKEALSKRFPVLRSS